jgi:hypothetical protein
VAGKLSWLQNIEKWALVQCRAAPRASEVSDGGTSCLGACNLSWCSTLIAGRCAYPGATAITNLSWVQEQKLRSVATKSRLGGAKTVTNLLILLSVLCVHGFIVQLFFLSQKCPLSIFGYYLEIAGLW